MKELLKLIDSLEEDSTNNLVGQKLPLVKQAICELFFIIEKVETIEDSASQFDLLDKIQYILAKYYFKRDIEIPKEIKRFIKDFDRVDDFDMRLHLFREIKGGNYRLD